jgi:hypothetical protein
MWKNRWRTVLKENDTSRPFLSLVICATMIFHIIRMSCGVAGYAPESNEPIDTTTLMHVMQPPPS